MERRDIGDKRNRKGQNSGRIIPVMVTQIQTGPRATLTSGCIGRGDSQRGRCWPCKRGQDLFGGVLLGRLDSWGSFSVSDGHELLQDPWRIPLTCLLKHWEDLDPQSQKTKALVFYCIEAWPKYLLGDKKTWPKGSSLNYNTILQLKLFCRREGK
jgi:hypothetical protein